MKCPKCNNGYVCPCESCAERNAGKDVWVEKDSIQSCPKCGLTKNVDEWMDEEYKQYEEIKDKA